MLKQEQFEQLIRGALRAKSERVNPPEGMGAKVRNAVLAGKGERISFYGWMFNWKKAVAMAACLTILGGGISLASSPGLQAWAGEKANNLLNRVHVVTQTQEVDGGVMASSEIEFQDSAADQAAQEVIERNRAKAGGIAYCGPPCATLAEAEKEAGFKIKAPVYFPDGYGLPQGIWVGEYAKDQDGKSVLTGKHHVSMRFDGGSEDNPQRLDYFISKIGMESKPGFRYEEINVGGKDARWYESEITLNENGQEPRQIIERAISWEDDGMTYLLNDATGLSKQELVMIVESIQ